MSVGMRSYFKSFNDELPPARPFDVKEIVWLSNLSPLTSKFFLHSLHMSKPTFLPLTQLQTYSLYVHFYMFLPLVPKAPSRYHSKNVCIANFVLLLNSFLGAVHKLCNVRGGDVCSRLVLRSYSYNIVWRYILQRRARSENTIFPSF